MERLVCVCVLFLTVSGALAQYPSSFGGCARTPTHPDTEFPSLAAIQKNAAVQEALSRVTAETAVTRVAKGTPGLSLVVVYGKDILMAKGFGSADSKGTPVDPLNTIFRIGSVGKLFTALSMMELRNRGLLNLDDVVTDHVPEFKFYTDPFNQERGVTFRQLATHSSGMPSNGPPSVYNKNVSAKEGFQMLKDTGKLHLIQRSDLLPKYSNLGFQALAQALSVVYKPNVSHPNAAFDMISELVLQPWGLNSTSRELKYPSRTAQGFVDASTPCVDSCWSPQFWAIGEGCEFSSAQDIVQLVKFFLTARGQTPVFARPGGTTLGPSVARELSKVSYVYSDFQSGYAMPLELYRLGPYWLRTKRGDESGFASEIAWIEELNFGVVVLANRVEHAAFYAQGAINALLPAVEAAIRGPGQPIPEPSSTALFLGKYSDMVGVEVEIHAGMVMSDNQGDNLAQLALAFNTTFRVEPSVTDQTSCFALSGGGQNWLEYVTFHVDGRNAVTGLYSILYGNLTKVQ